jgi:hypothetical protein
MKRLNFFPFYESLLRSCEKTTTFRLTRPPFEKGDDVIITVGWEEATATELHLGLIRDVYARRICDLNEHDFEGESPDCKSVEATQLVLACIYRTVLRLDHEIWVVKFEHNKRSKEL